MKKSLFLSIAVLTITSFYTEGKVQAQINYNNSACNTDLVQNKTVNGNGYSENKTSPIIQQMIANQLYHFGFDRDAEIPINPSETTGPYIDDFREGNKWLNSVNKKVVSIPFIDNDGQEKKLYGYFVENSKKSNKTIIFSHGYRMNALQVGGWVKMYYDMGYNILVPDSRAHGQSEGNDISFGWKEKEDYKNWVNYLISMNDDMQIIISGVSMGGATTMMASGESMPENVKGYIEDSGYTSIYDEFEYLQPTAKDILNKYFEENNINIIVDDDDLYKVIKLLNAKLLSKQGFTLEEASSISQLHKNKKPVLFIHGQDDILVPTSAAYKSFEATQGKKDLWIVPETGHGLAIIQDRPEYKQRVEKFLNEIL